MKSATRALLLRQIDNKIDFEFVREMTAHPYCLDNRCPSIVVRLCIETGLVTGKRVMMDGSYMKADAALDSLVPREPEKAEGSTETKEPKDNVSNIKDGKQSKKSKYIKGKKFSNETHVSKTDPDSTLAGKSGEPKQLRYKDHCTIDRDSRKNFFTQAILFSLIWPLSTQLYRGH